LEDLETSSSDGRVNKELIVDWSEFDPSRVLLDRAAIERINPHRHELSLLDGILFEDLPSRRCVGLSLPRPNDFWTRGHFPGRPLMPGVLICEVAAQLCAYMAIKSDVLTDGTVGLGGLDGVRFRRPVLPGDPLVMMTRIDQVRSNAMIRVSFQGWIGQEIACDGKLTGVALPNETPT
jgi:3-hydroxyacyl-[acyl-carrier-protein] dehydratase